MFKENLPLAAVVLAASLLGACGQKGPLYLPQDAASPAPVPAQSPIVAPTSSTTPGAQAETTEEQEETRRKNDSETAADELEPAVEK